MYQVPVSKRSLKQNQFEFRLPDSEQVYSIPLPQFIPPSILKELGELEMADFFFKYLDRQVPGILDKLEGMDQLTGLLEAWQEEGRLSLGESGSSSTSSTSTSQPSATSSDESASTSTTSSPATSAGPTSTP